MQATAEAELRRRAADLVLDWHTAGTPDTLDAATEADFAQLVEAAYVVNDEAAHSLKRWVDAGRRAGLSWADIGEILGVSRQAAQQRFGAEGGPTMAQPSSDDIGVLVRTGVTAFNEVQVLKEEGEAGREVIGATWLTLYFRQTDHRCENIRVVSPLPGVKEKYEKQGWKHALTWYPYRYFTRPAM